MGYFVGISQTHKNSKDFTIRSAEVLALAAPQEANAILRRLITEPSVLTDFNGSREKTSREVVLEISCRKKVLTPIANKEGAAKLRMAISTPILATA